MKQGLLLLLLSLPLAALPQQAARHAPTAELGARLGVSQAGLLKGQRQGMVLLMEQLMVLLAGQLGLSVRQGPRAGCKGAHKALLAGLLRLVARQSGLSGLRRLLLLKMTPVGLLQLALRQASPARLLHLLHRLLPVSLLLAGLLRLTMRRTVPARVQQIAVLLAGHLRLLQSQASPARSGQRGTLSPSSRPSNSRLLPVQQRMYQPCCPRLSQATLLSTTQGPRRLWSSKRQQGLRGRAGPRSGQTLQWILQQGPPHGRSGGAETASPVTLHLLLPTEQRHDPVSLQCPGMRMQMKSCCYRPPSSSGVPLLVLGDARPPVVPNLQEAAGPPVLGGPGSLGSPVMASGPDSGGGPAHWLFGDIAAEDLTQVAKRSQGHSRTGILQRDLAWDASARGTLRSDTHVPEPPRAPLLAVLDWHAPGRQ